MSAQQTKTNKNQKSTKTNKNQSTTHGTARLNSKHEIWADRKNEIHSRVFSDAHIKRVVKAAAKNFSLVNHAEKVSDRGKMLRRFRNGPHARRPRSARENGHPPRQVNSRSRRVHAAPLAVTNSYRAPALNAGRQRTTVTRTEVIDLTIDDLKVDSGFFRWDTSATHFGVTINPGNPALTTWLSRIAALYEEFEFHELSITYNPSCPATTPGILAMGFDIDSTDPPPNSFAEMLQIGGSTSFAPWTSGTISIPREFLSGKRTNAKFIETDPTATVDLNKALATFYFISSGGEATPGSEVQIGYLSITYKVTLLMPQLHEAIPGFLHVWTDHMSDISNVWNHPAEEWDDPPHHVGPATNLFERGWTITGASVDDCVITIPGDAHDVKSGVTYMVQRSFAAPGALGVDSSNPNVTGDIQIAQYFHGAEIAAIPGDASPLKDTIRSGSNGGSDHNIYKVVKTLLFTVGAEGGTITIVDPTIGGNTVKCGELLIMQMPRNWFVPMSRSALTEVKQHRPRHAFLIERKVRECPPTLPYPRIEILTDDEIDDKSDNGGRDTPRPKSAGAAKSSRHSRK
jgi:hypothetical protein